MIKPILLLLIITAAINTNAQRLIGIVSDSSSRKPISNVQIISSLTTVLSNDEGKFVINHIKAGNKISFRMMGYETIEVSIKPEMFTSNFNIRLVANPIKLKEVNIQGNRNYKNDSLLLRKEYAAVFAYKTPDFTDMFVKIDPSYRSPHSNINHNSTASILKFNVLSAFSFLNKKQQSTSKLKQILLKDEELNYVDFRFSKIKIQSVTSLKGDSLFLFTKLYRPSYVEVKEMNDYQIILHIKKSYTEFIKSENRSN